MTIAVMAKVSGGSVKSFEASTVGELKLAMNLDGEHTAESSTEGTVKDDHALSEGEFIVFAKQVKGGC